MQQRLRQLGWLEIDIVDDDLDRSAAGTVTRAGFERMVAEVCLGQVGAVAAREVSRFARNSREWQRLVEVCRMVDTLLIDQETVYTPRQSNDRLLLGLKGSLNEYELIGGGTTREGSPRRANYGRSGWLHQNPGSTIGKGSGPPHSGGRATGVHEVHGTRYRASGAVVAS